MNTDGHIYVGTKEEPVTPEDVARLEGFLFARAEADSLKRKAALRQDDRDYLVQRAEEIMARKAEQRRPIR